MIEIVIGQHRHCCGTPQRSTTGHAKRLNMILAFWKKGPVSGLA
jgi:hypothetical protein